jgi:hypothetical protein
MEVCTLDGRGGPDRPSHGGGPRDRAVFLPQRRDPASVRGDEDETSRYGRAGPDGLAQVMGPLRLDERGLDSFQTGPRQLVDASHHEGHFIGRQQCARHRPG